MKIAWVSSWPPRPCGIATYSLELVDALRKKGGDVYIVCHTDGGKPGEKNVYPVINLDEVDWAEKLYSVVGEIKPDIVHIQHEYGLYSVNDDYSAGLLRPLFRWKLDDSFPVVITYHSVYSKMDRARAMFMDLMQRLVHAGIVHEYYQWISLPYNLGRMVSNVYVIPHGAKENLLFSRQEAKKYLGLEGKKTIGMIGWFVSTKGFHRVIKMWDILSEELGPDTYLILAGEARRGEESQREYKARLLSLVEDCRNKHRIKLLIKSFSPEEYERVLACFDIAVFPYTFISQSGNLAHSLALGVPVVASAIEGLEAEVKASGAGILVPPDDDDELKRAIVTLLKDDRLREKYSKRALNYVKNKIGWSIVAEKHIKLYDKLLKEKSQKT